MRYLALASDYDGTLAEHGRVAERTLAALDRLAASGRKLILVTGRELDDLIEVFPEHARFDRVVAENGAVLYRPGSKQVRVLCDPPPPALLETLRARKVSPLSAGHVIVSTWVPHEAEVLQAIRALGLELQVIFNKGAVMVLPSGVNKASGLDAALAELELSPRNTVGVGDAENDHAFLARCELGVAVANALPMVQERADLITRAVAGAGVVEVIEELIADDLRRRDPARHQILLGERADGGDLQLCPYGHNLLIAGTSGSGKSTVAMAVLERMTDRGYQVCIIDPEGDYQAFQPAVVLGDARRVPSPEEVMQVLADPRENAVANLLGLRLEDRPGFLAALLPRLQELRGKTGRPHWILIDETHHLLPTPWQPASLTLSQELHGLILITVHPGKVAPPVLGEVDAAIAVGEQPGDTLGELAEVIGVPAPAVAEDSLATGEVLVWQIHAGQDPVKVRVAPGRVQHLRHRRKYAEGELGEDRSFYFRGAGGKLKLRAQNLMLFLQLADGVDDETWIHHLRQGDYSRWFREMIKDDVLAGEAERVEQARLSPAESRAGIRAAVERYYTVPAA